LGNVSTNWTHGADDTQWICALRAARRGAERHRVTEMKREAGFVHPGKRTIQPREADLWRTQR